VYHITSIYVQIYISVYAHVLQIVTLGIYLNSILAAQSIVVALTRTKLYKVESKSMATGKNTYRHSIFLEKAFVEDSLFPFKAGDNLIARIESDKLVIAKEDNVPQPSHSSSF
jgi:hypothetical protein